MEEKTKKAKVVKTEKNKVNLVLPVITLFIGAACMYLLIYYVLPLNASSTVINKLEKEVTVTDQGIADAVDKLYDATVIVKLGSQENPTGSGSGFVYKTDDKYGYIVTNYHVTENNKTVFIEYTDGSTTEGEVLNGDEKIDVSLIRVPKDTILAVAKIGKSHETKLGDTVFAIGTPVSMSYKFTVTRGILSGKDRLVEMSNGTTNIFGQTTGDTWYISLLQIDASINSGNSGGPLANANGEVIGITNSKLSSSYSNASATIENIGFAIPIEDALVYVDAFISGKTVERPLLGVSMIDLSDRWSLYQKGITLNTELTTGAVVIEVQKGSPADKAGLKRGDIIIGLNDAKVEDSKTLQYSLYKQKVGDTIKVTYEREGKKETTDVTLNVARES